MWGRGGVPLSPPPVPRRRPGGVAGRAGRLRPPLHPAERGAGRAPGHPPRGAGQRIRRVHGVLPPRCHLPGTGPRDTEGARGVLGIPYGCLGNSGGCLGFPNGCCASVVGAQDAPSVPPTPFAPHQARGVPAGCCPPAVLSITPGCSEPPLKPSASLPRHSASFPDAQSPCWVLSTPPRCSAPPTGAGHPSLGVGVPAGRSAPCACRRVAWIRPSGPCAPALALAPCAGSTR